MPAKFDRCVRKVKASLKRARRSGNAYAICNAATKRNPIPMGHGAVEGVHWKPLLLIIGGAVAVGTAIVLAAKPAPAATNPQQPPQQQQPPQPPPGTQVYRLDDAAAFQQQVASAGWNAARFCGYVECGPPGGQFAYCDTIGCATVYDLLVIYQQYVQSNGIGGFAMYYWLCTQDLNGPCP